MAFMQEAMHDDRRGLKGKYGGWWMGCRKDKWYESLNARWNKKKPWRLQNVKSSSFHNAWQRNEGDIKLKRCGREDEQFQMTPLTKPSPWYYQYFLWACVIVVSLKQWSFWWDDIAQNIYDDAFEYTSTYWDDFALAEAEGRTEMRERCELGVEIVSSCREIRVLIRVKASGELSRFFCYAVLVS